MQNYSRCDDAVEVFNWTKPPLGETAQDALRFGELVVYAVCMSLLLTSIAVTGFYMKFRINEFDRLKARSFPLVVAGHFGAMVQLHTGSFSKFMQANVPCIWYVIMCVIIVPLLLLPLSVKLIQLQKREIITQVAAQQIELDDEMPSTGSLDMHRDRTPTRILRAFQSARNDLRILFSRRLKSNKVQLDSRENSPSSQSAGKGKQATSYSPFIGNANRDLLLWKYSVGSHGVIVTLALLNLPFLGLAFLSFAFVHPIYLTSCSGCSLSPVHAIFIVLEGILALLTAGFLYWKFRNIEDPFGVLQEIRWAVLFGGMPSLLAFIVYSVDDQGNSIGFSFNMVIAVSLLCFSFVQGWFQVLLAERDAKDIELQHLAGMAIAEGEIIIPEGNEENDESKDHVVHDTPIPGTPGGRIQSSRTSVAGTGLNYSALMQVILSDKVLRNAFHAHLCEEHNVEPLTFIDAVDRWRRYFPTSTSDVSYRRAKRILKTFVGPRAPFSLHLSVHVVDMLIRRTARPDTLTIDCFDAARAEIVKILEFGPLVRFVKSNIWRGFVEDGLIRSPEQYGRHPRTSNLSMHSTAPSAGEVSEVVPPLRLRNTASSSTASTPPH